MARVPDLPAEQLSAEQKRIHDNIAGARGGVVRGPFAIWLRQPGLADAANRLGNVLRIEGRLDKRLFELMVLVVARHWSAQYEWFVHAQAARKAGLSAEVVEELRQGRRPAFKESDEALVYEIVTELLETRSLAQPAYERGIAAFGLDLMIELVTGAGFYALVAMMLNAFDAPVPDGGRPLAP